MAGRGRGAVAGLDPAKLKVYRMSIPGEPLG